VSKGCEKTARVARENVWAGQKLQQEKPGKTILIALGVGAGLGILLGAGSRHSRTRQVRPTGGQRATEMPWRFSVSRATFDRRYHAQRSQNRCDAALVLFLSDTGSGANCFYPGVPAAVSHSVFVSSDPAGLARSQSSALADAGR